MAQLASAAGDAIVSRLLRRGHLEQTARVIGTHLPDEMVGQPPAGLGVACLRVGDGLAHDLPPGLGRALLGERPEIVVLDSAAGAPGAARIPPPEAPVGASARFQAV